MVLHEIDYLLYKNCEWIQLSRLGGDWLLENCVLMNDVPGRRYCCLEKQEELATRMKFDVTTTSKATVVVDTHSQANFLTRQYTFVF